MNKNHFGLNTKQRDEYYIVSLTSFPARINDLWLTIETILRQNFKPDKIILWLGKSEFANINLPKSLVELQQRGLTIKFCEDLRSHTKYFYAFQEYKDFNVITLDDDVYYPKNILSNLVNLHKKFPKNICSNRVHKITFQDNSVKKYRDWMHNYNKIEKPSHLLFQTGFAGVLYPPDSLSPEVFNKDVFKQICYFADDIWLKIHAVRNDTKIVTNNTFNKDLISIGKTQKQKLVNKNVFEGGNDTQLKNILNHYKINLVKDLENCNQ